MTLAVSVLQPPVASTLPPSLLPAVAEPPASDAPPAVAPPVLVLILGLDEAGRPHASRFEGKDAAPAREAAAAMGMVALGVETERLRKLAAELPPGRLFASGRAFVPFVRQALYDQLVAHLPKSVARPTRPARTIEASAAVPNGDANLSAGGDAASPGAGDGNPTSGAAAKLAAPTAGAPRGSLPENWNKLKVGNLVLASLERDDGWWPAIVTEDKGDGLFVLAWQDWTDWEPFLRKREELALLHPNYAAK